MKKTKNLESKIPKIGQEVYVPTQLYLGHGRDDFSGGLCTIIGIKEGRSAGKSVPFVEVEKRPGHWYNWEYLLENQAEWKKVYGKQRGYPDPDYRTEFNIDHW